MFPLFSAGLHPHGRRVNVRPALEDRLQVAQKAGPALLVACHLSVPLCAIAPSTVREVNLRAPVFPRDRSLHRCRAELVGPAVPDEFPLHDLDVFAC